MSSTGRGGGWLPRVLSFYNMQLQSIHIITDLGFGDSGKGAITDRIAALPTGSGPKVVIRYTGGSQAGHTVDLNKLDHTEADERHIHASFAAGTLAGVSSHMSVYCPIYPQNLIREAQVLESKTKRVLSDFCTVDPFAPMVTIYDVAWNRANKSGCNTCGLGIGATMERMQTEARTYMSDLLHPMILAAKLRAVHSYYIGKLNDLFTGKHGARNYIREKFEDYVAAETIDPAVALDYVTLQTTASILRTFPVVIFEGAQGVMLDQDHGTIPFTTWGHTTCRNAVEIIKRHRTEADVIHLHHVTRAYQTRHGDGPMGREPLDVPEDATNVNNVYQGPFRTSMLDMGLIDYAKEIDSLYFDELRNLDPRCVYKKSLHVTCCDHVDAAEYQRVVIAELAHRFGRGYSSIKAYLGPRRHDRRVEVYTSP